jgi:exonuclease VII small subunit
LVKYERGMFLIQHSRTVLNAAEQQIELLTKGDAAPAAPQPSPAPAPDATPQ